MRPYGDLLSHAVGAEDVAFDNAGLFRFPYVGDTLGENGVAVVRSAISGKEADETLLIYQVLAQLLCKGRDLKWSIDTHREGRHDCNCTGFEEQQNSSRGKITERRQ